MKLFFVAMQELDRVLNRDDVVGSRRVDAVDHRRKGSGLARPGGSRDQNKPALLFADGFHGARQVQLFDGADFGGITRNTMPTFPRCWNTLTRKRPRPATP